MLNGKAAEESAGMREKSIGQHTDILNEAAMEFPVFYQSPNGTYPLFVPFVEDLFLASPQFGSPLRWQFSAGKGALHADEFGPGGAGRIALLFQPVGEDQTRRIVIGMRQNVLQEGVGVRHGLPLSISATITATP